MGLKNLTRKEFKQIQKLLKCLEILGITEEDLRLIAEIKTLKNEVDLLKGEIESKNKLSKKEQELLKAEMEKKYKSSHTPQDYRDLFTAEIEEFDPYA